MEKIKWIEEYLEEALKLAWMEGHEPASRECAYKILLNSKQLKDWIVLCYDSITIISK